MVAANRGRFRLDASYFGYAEACEVARRIAGDRSGGIVHIHLEGTIRTSTAALARLILLRRTLLRSGRDLCIIGLSGRAAGLYEISRLGKLLPRRSDAEA